MSAPATSTRPALGLIRPRRHIRSVVLPLPLGPTTATDSPERTVNSRSVKMGRSDTAWVSPAMRNAPFV